MVIILYYNKLRKENDKGVKEMKDLNSIQIIGRLTRDPELKDAGSYQVVNFSIAVNGFKKDESYFFDCQAWGKLATDIIMPYIKKGNRVGITGDLKQQTWNDKDGGKRSKVIIEVSTIQNLTPKQQDQSFDSLTKPEDLF